MCSEFVVVRRHFDTLWVKAFFLVYFKLLRANFVLQCSLLHYILNYQLFTLIAPILVPWGGCLGLQKLG